MKICTITCHDVNNYGASLQAYALQEYLVDLGHDVCIIDYKPEYQVGYKFSSNVSKESVHWALYQRFPILKYVKGIESYLMSIPTRGRIKAFRRFKFEKLHLTEQFTSYSQLVENPPLADVYIAGSDQIWNTKLRNGSDPAYYMQFGDKSIRRISYAASFAISYIANGYEVLVHSMLSSIDSISVRELSGIDVLNKLGYSGIQVLDPVFLLSAEIWKTKLNICEKERIIKEKYILVYDLGHNIEEMRNMALSLATNKGYKIVAVNDKKRTSYADININDADPIMFLRLIADAQYVIADSFHATALSLIFHKPFYTFYKRDNISRLEDLLSIVGLSNRLNSSEILEDPNWDLVQSILDTHIERSKGFIKAELVV